MNPAFTLAALFESSVILYGIVSREDIEAVLYEFESSVVLYGNELRQKRQPRDR